MIDLSSLAPLKPVLERQCRRLRLALLVTWGVVMIVPARGNTVAAGGANDFDQCNVPAGLTGVVAVSAGLSHSLALRSNGTVAAWGINGYGQSTVPGWLTGAMSIAAGHNHSLALLSSGMVVGWGNNQFGRITTPPGLNGVVAIAAGEAHSLALRNNGTVIAWGWNEDGQTTVPIGLSGVVAIAAGSRHSLALRSDGTVAAWGFNNRGQTTVPPGLSGVVAISAGDWHSLALRSDGTCVAWGNNPGGTHHATVSGWAGVMAISAASAGWYSLALRNDGTVVTAGYNSFGQITVPAGLAGVVGIAGGGNHSLWITGAGGVPVIVSPARPITEAAMARPSAPLFQQRIIASGLPTSYGAAGLPPGLVITKATGVISGAATALGEFTVTLSATNAAGTGTRTIILSVTGFPSAAPLPAVMSPAGQFIPWPGAGTSFSAVGLPAGLGINDATAMITGTPVPGNYESSITVSNAYGTIVVPWTVTVVPVIAWGDNDYGQRALQPGLNGVLTVAAGGDYALALRTNGTVAVWGDNAGGDSAAPSGLTDVIAITAGKDHALALHRTGTVTEWGFYYHGQSAGPPGLSGVVAVAAGGQHSLALRSNGTVVAWGDNNSGQTTVPAGLSGIVAIGAGSKHSLALRSDGTVVAWGAYESGPVGVPAGLTGVVAVAGGCSHSLALRSDGTVVAWGENFYGQSAIPNSLTGVVAIAAGDNHSLALRSDGTVAAWGHNIRGQSVVPTGLTGVVAIAAGGEFSMCLVGSAGVPVISSPLRLITEAAGARATVPFFQQRILASGAPVSYNAVGLPSGLVINGATGVISGIATVPGEYAVPLSATNAAGTGTRSILLTVMGQPFAPPLPAVIRPVRQSILWPGPAASYTAAGLPVGLAINGETGAISGTPAPGIYHAELTASNVSGTATVVWDVEVLTWAFWGGVVAGQHTEPIGLAEGIALSAGRYHSLALLSDGTVAAWGLSENTYYQLTVPPGLSGVVAVAAGSNHSLALRSDGTVTGWGANYVNQALVPDGVSEVIAIAAGGLHNLALKGNGTVAAWGYHTSGQITVPSGLTGVKAIAAGGGHSLAARDDGSVVAWGSNNNGQSTVPPGLSGVVALAAGAEHSLALRGDGTVVAWGLNNRGQCTIPAGLAGVVAIAAGASHSLALRSDGSAVGWGYNDDGQSQVPAGLTGAVSIAAGVFNSLALVPPSFTLRRPAGLPVSILAPRPIPGATYTAEGLPPDLSLHIKTALLSGTPAVGGIYSGTITATLGAQTRSLPLSIVITPAPGAGLAAYDAWRAVALAGVALAAPEQDADGDGLTNAVEFALGTPPHDVEVSSEPALAKSQSIARDASGRLTLTIQVPAAALEQVLFNAEFAGSLTFPAAPAILTPELLPGAPAGQLRLRFTDNTSASAPRRFGRLAVTLP